MRQILPLMTENNSDELMAKAETLSVRSLDKEIKIFGSTEKLPPLVSFRCLLEKDDYEIVMESIERAKMLREKDSIGLALVMICQDWLGDNGP